MVVGSGILYRRWRYLGSETGHWSGEELGVGVTVDDLRPLLSLRMFKIILGEAGDTGKQSPNFLSPVNCSAISPIVSLAGVWKAGSRFSRWIL